MSCRQRKIAPGLWAFRIPLFALGAVACILCGCTDQGAGPEELIVVDLTRETHSSSGSPDQALAGPVVTPDAITVPPGMELSFFVDLPAESTVVFDSLAGAPLTVAIERALGGPRTEQTVEASNGPVRITVPSSSSRIAVVTL